MPGDRLPTEPWLAEKFGVARSTVREALKQLEQEGLVDAVQGRGRFLSGIGSLAIERPITRYEGIADMLGNLGYRVSTMVLSADEIEMSAEEANALDTEEGHPAIRLRRIRFGDDQPLVYSTDVILREALPGPITHRDWSAPVTAALAAQGHEITSSAAHISAVDLPPDVEKRHNLGGLGPWLLVTETCITRSGTRVLAANDYHRGDVIGFNVLRRR
ncbi:MAG: GntR family transcriptional regulator [Microbacteriaceae bacterium]|nr:MAG: GntR family transcriptional regulator [Microbacteriaceae bacterium]